MTTTPEALTPEERAEIDSYGDHGPMDNPEYLASKLLRIHDQQAARIEELRRYVVTQDTVARVRTNELEAENARLREANHASKDLRQACQDKKQLLYGEIDRLEKRVAQLEASQAFKGPLG